MERVNELDRAVLAALIVAVNVGVLVALARVWWAVVTEDDER